MTLPPVALRHKPAPSRIRPILPRLCQRSDWTNVPMCNRVKALMTGRIRNRQRHAVSNRTSKRQRHAVGNRTSNRTSKRMIHPRTVPSDVGGNLQGIVQSAGRCSAKWA